MIWIDSARQDIWLAIRGLRHVKVFGLGVVVLLALGVAVNVVMLTEAAWVLLDPPAHVVHPKQVARVYVTQRFPGFGEQTLNSVSYPQYVALRASEGPFAGAAVSAETQVSIGTPSSSERITASLVSGGFFPLLGTTPLAGRFFSASDDALPAGQPVVVLSEGFWRRRFGSDRGILGQAVPIDGMPYTIIGVAPVGFTGADLDRVAAWIPLSAGAAGVVGKGWSTNTQAAWLSLIVRMRGGATIEQSAGYLTHVLRTMAERPTWADPAIRATLRPIRGVRNPDGTLTHEARIAGWLTGVALAVLLIACANVTNLLLARVIQRRRETAVRIALGSSKARLITQSCWEAVVLAAIASGAALVLTRWSMGALNALLLPNVAPPAEQGGARAIIATLALGLGLGVSIGLATAVRGFGGDVAGELRGGRSVRHRTGVRRQAGLIIGQTMLSTLLLVGAGLFLRSLYRARGADLGFNPTNVLVVTTEASSTGESHTELGSDAGFERVQHLRGVVAASRSMTVPFSLLLTMNVRTPGRDSLPVSAGAGPYGNYVSPSYFRLLGIRIRRGRPFTDADRQGALPVAVINETMARILWPGQGALGQCITVEPAKACATIVGIANDVHQHAIDERVPMQLYLPFAQRPATAGPGRVLLKTAGAATPLIPQLRDRLAAIDPSATYVGVQPLGSLIDPQRRAWQVGAMLFGLFATLALVVTSLGTYSIVAHNTAQRRRELGVRLALGARPRDVFGLVLEDGVRLAAVGIALGLGASLALAPHLAGLLFRTSAYDAVVYGGVSLLLLGAAAVATFIPARLAARIDPALSMRAE